MKTDILIRHEGFQALFDKLDILEVERFIVLIKRDSFDYTEWRKNLWEDLSIDELSEKAMNYYLKKND